MKLRFCDVLDRILTHFKELISSEDLFLNRVYEGQSLDMGARVNLEITKVFDRVNSIGLLYDLIEEDLKTMHSTDSSSAEDDLRKLMLLKMYTDKLP